MHRALAVLATWAALLPLNGVFHAVIAAAWFDGELAGLSPVIRPMREASPLPIVCLDAILALVVVVLVGRDPTPSRGFGARTGALVNLASSGAWNLANAASFVTWSHAVTVVDVAWHVTLGAFAGAVAAAVLRVRLAQRRAT